MRKILAGFFLTLRWLLVLLLPLVGLAVGAWLIPETKPIWEKALENPVCGGIIDYEGKACVIALGDRILHNALPAREVTGIEVATGKEAFCKFVPDDDDTLKIDLIPGTHFVLYHFFSNQMMLFDWKAHHEVERFEMPERMIIVHTPILRNNVLACENGRKSKLVICQRRALEHSPALEIALSGYPMHNIQLSAQGTWVIDCDVYRYGLPGIPAKDPVPVFETKQGKQVCSLPEDVHYIRWHDTDDNSLLALRRNLQTNSEYWQRFVLKDGSFQPIEPRFPAMRGVVRNQTPSPFVVLECFNTLGSLRVKLFEIAGGTLREILNRCWPVRRTLEVYQADTGLHVQSLPLPVPDMSTISSTTVHPTPDGQGLVLQRGMHLTYWQFQPSKDWYWWTGLAFGTILAIGLAWFNLRRSAKIPVALQATHCCGAEIPDPG